MADAVMAIAGRATGVMFLRATAREARRAARVEAARVCIGLLGLVEDRLAADARAAEVQTILGVAAGRVGSLAATHLVRAAAGLARIVAATVLVDWADLPVGAAFFAPVLVARVVGVRLDCRRAAEVR